ncbi:ATPase [Methanobrevibacter millerae]|uniref:Uncharacterized protein n=1 Tax=Methanobrevibacter millerae TaxID=230361 RepID=A0A1G5X935_9EURY|nr:ATPase [Methanobrevibacter millerae]SDA66978.1 hypothetical protein SAMN02910315_02055 [Methanobrevibacter millerae]
MNETILLIWAIIAIVGIIAVIAVKLYYRDKDDEKEDFTNITTQNPLQEMISEQEKKNSSKINNNTKPKNPVSDYFARQNEPEITLRKEGTRANTQFDPYIVPETNRNNNMNRNISYSSQNQVLINYEDNVQKFQEPITETQRDIMNKNNNEDKNSDVSYTKTSESKHELKDLFTIDELIKESKRKDDEREKESQTIRKEEDDNSDIKESIKKNQEAAKKDDEIRDIEDIRSSIEKMHEIAEAIKASDNEDVPSQAVASQKDIDEAIDSASNEAEEEITEISETNSITDAVIKKESEDTTVQETLDVKEESVPEEKAESVEESVPEEKPEIFKEEVPEEKTESIKDAIPESEEIKTPTLKSPTKVEEDSVSILSGADEDYEFGASIDSSNLFEDENGELSDLDYRKDLAKFTNSIKNSGIVKDIRQKLAPESSDDELDSLNEDFIRNVNSYTDEANEFYDDYDDYAPIINETHEDYVEPEEDEIRQENTRRVFENAKSSASIDNILESEPIPTPKAIPEKSSLKVLINNNEEVLRKGDEIIFNHEGDTYSSKVYSINGDDIKVKYRRQDITIKPSDIKKIY